MAVHIPKHVKVHQLNNAHVCVVCNIRRRIGWYLCTITMYVITVSCISFQLRNSLFWRILLITLCIVHIALCFIVYTLVDEVFFRSPIIQTWGNTLYFPLTFVCYGYWHELFRHERLCYVSKFIFELYIVWNMLHVTIPFVVSCLFCYVILLGISVAAYLFWFCTTRCKLLDISIQGYCNCTVP